MDGEAMQKNFDDILNGNGGHKKDFEITPEEATKFKAAMADPEFQNMLRDYMEEMQDPAQRAEQESYISELEGQNRVPNGKEVVHPLPGFVIKTKFTRGAKDATPEKLFANVVTSDKLAKPFSKASSARPGGESWSLPVAVGPLRMEKDKSGGSTTTFDVCYHPEALVQAHRLDAFRDLVALSSLERVEDAFLRGTNQKMTVDKNYRILKGVKYKSGPCATMVVAKADMNRITETKQATPVPETTTNARQNSKNTKEAKKLAKAAKSAAAAAAAASSRPAAAAAAAAAEFKTEARGTGGGTKEESLGEGKGGEDGEPPASTSADKPAEEEEELAPGVKRGNEGATYKLVESGAFEIADHTSDRVRRLPTPQKIIAMVTLPANAEPTRKLDVVVTVRRLVIGVLGDPESSPPRYLDIPLPYDVEDDSKCSAARDKTGLLKITMPVKPPPAPPAPRVPAPPAPATPAATAPVAAEGDGCVDGVDGGGPDAGDDDGGGATGGAGEEKKEISAQEVEPDSTDRAQEKGGPSDATPSQRKPDQRKPDHSRWVMKGPPSKVLEKPWEALPKGSIGELPPPPPLQPHDGDAEATSEGDPQREDQELEEQLAQDRDKSFVPCKRFIKKIDGYEFKTGMKGCGYYRDDKDKKTPPITWNENVKTVCGVVEVPNIVDASVYCRVAGNAVVLSFDAEAPPAQEGAGRGLERFRTELVLPGGVAASKCSHDTAEDNLVLKLVKEPECEWGSTPTLARRTQVASALDELVGGAAAADADAAGPGAGEGTAAAAASEGAGAKAAAAAGTAKAEAVGLAPGYENQKTRPKDPLNSLAFELDG